MALVALVLAVVAIVGVVVVGLYALNTVERIGSQTRHPSTPDPGEDGG